METLNNLFSSKRERRQLDPTERFRNLRDSGIPERHLLNASNAQANASPWLKEYERLKPLVLNGGIFVLLGDRGVGKTQMAVCLMLAANLLGRSVQYTTAMDLFRELRRCFNSVDADEGKITAKYTNAEVLVLDDAHDRGHTDYESRTLNNMIDKRYYSLRTTIIITNHSQAEFAAAFGRSIVDRINETGDAVVLDWPSFRTRPQG